MDKKTRQLQFDSINETEQNILQFSVASSAPYLRTEKDWQYNEILTISEDAINFERLVDGKCPFLFQHQTDKQIGVVEKAFIQDGKLKVFVRFSENEFAQMILKDIKAGIRRNVSLGYMVDEAKVERSQQSGQPDNVYVIKWTPYECSSVSCPADHTVGFQRNLEIKEDIEDMKKECDEKLEMKEEPIVQEDKGLCGEQQNQDCQNCQKQIAPEQVQEEVKQEVMEEVAEQAVETKAEPTDAISGVVEDVVDETADILAAGELADQMEMARQCIAEKKSLEDFKNMVKQKRNINSNKDSKKDNPNMNKEFSIVNAIRSVWKGDVDATYEMQESAKLLRGMKSDDDFAFKPSYKRDLDGSALINTQYLPSEYTPVNRPKTTLDMTGYRAVPSEGNPISFAVQTSGAVGGMYSIDGELTADEPTWTLKTVTPHKAGALVIVPYSLILQAKPQIKGLIEDDIVKALGEVRDKQALVGNGTSGQCTGIYNTTGVNTIPVSAAFSLSGVTDMETKIRSSNDFATDLCWVMNADSAAKYKTTLKDKSAKGEYLINDEGKMIGYPVYINNQLSNNQIVLGNFAELVVTDFGAITVKVDDITYIKKQAIQLIAHQEFDVLVRKPKSFSIVKD